MANITESLTSQGDLRLPVPGEPISTTEAPHRIHELAAALAARDRFIALVGHELRNALAPMVLLAEQFGMLAEGSQPPGKLLSRVAMLNGNLNKLISTIGRIVEVADLRRGKLQLEPTTANMVEVVEEVCREARAEAAAHGTQLVIDAAGPVVGRWDRVRVKQIAANLVSNAIRHGGGGRVDVAIHSSANDGALVVEDRGPGIDPDRLPHLFELADQDARRTGGLGIGLWAVKTLCHAMRGSVTLENRTDGGTRVCVILPRG
jgi:two-component system, OmpR family, sensor kinase